MMVTLVAWIATAFIMNGQTSKPWVSVQEAGTESMAFVAQTEPFKPGVQPRAGEAIVARDTNGRTITGFAYYGWMVGASVRVLVLAAVPADSAKSSSFPTDSAGTRYEQVAEFTLAIGESRRVEEMKAFGREPNTIRVAAR